MTKRFWFLYVATWIGVALFYPVLIVLLTRYFGWVGCVLGGVC